MVGAAAALAGRAGSLKPPAPRLRGPLLHRAIKSLNAALLNTPLSAECMMHQGLAAYLGATTALAAEDVTHATGTSCSGGRQPGPGLSLTLSDGCLGDVFRAV